MSALRRLLIISVTEGRIAALRHAEPRRRTSANDNPAHLSSTRGGAGCSPSAIPTPFHDPARSLSDADRLAGPDVPLCHNGTMHDG